MEERDISVGRYNVDFNYNSSILNNGITYKLLNGFLKKTGKVQAALANEGFRNSK